MTETDFLALVSGTTRGPLATILRAGLSGLSLGYRAGVGLRNRLFDHGFKFITPPPVPTISVGNLTVGGTGKTPLVAELVNQLVGSGNYPVILSRGYRSLNDEGNDEKRVLDRLCPDVPHLQDPDRVASAQRAVADHGADCLVLDDGFQHRRLGRTLDLVLIDVTNPWGYGSVLPRGLLREPITGLRRADAVILTRCDRAIAAERDSIRSTIHRHHPSCPIIESEFPVTGLRTITGERLPWETVLGQRAVAFSGIGRPENFFDSLTAWGVPPIETVSYPDHHHYTTDDRNRLAWLTRSVGADCLLTTLKDLVKFPPETPDDRPIYAVEIGVRFTRGEAELIRLLHEAVPTRARLAA